jgi:hypothetical protein
MSDNNTKTKKIIKNRFIDFGGKLIIVCSIAFFNKKYDTKSIAISHIMLLETTISKNGDTPIAIYTKLSALLINTNANSIISIKLIITSKLFSGLNNNTIVTATTLKLKTNNINESNMLCFTVRNCGNICFII